MREMMCLKLEGVVGVELNFLKSVLSNLSLNAAVGVKINLQV